MTTFGNIRFVVCHSNTYSKKWTVRKEESFEGRLILIDMKSFHSKSKAEAFKKRCEEGLQ